MKAVMERLDAERVRYKKTTAFRLKVGPFNFYPDTGRIYVDREPKSRPEVRFQTAATTITVISAVRNMTTTLSNR
jgi:hypothetical protein